MNLPEDPVWWTEILAAMAGAFTALVAAARTVYRTAKRVEALVAKVERIDAALGPNGGSSIRDAIDRIECRQHAHLARLRAISDREDQGAFETDPDGRHIWVNRAYCKIAGLDSDAAIDFGWLVAVRPDERSRVMEEWRGARDQKRDFFLPSIAMSRGDVACMRATCIVNQVGKVTGFVGFLRTIPGNKGASECISCQTTIS